VGFSPEERENMEQQGSNPQDFCNTAQPPPNSTVTEERRGEETWCVTTTEFKDLEELHSLYGQWEGIQINRLEISDGRFNYDVDLDTSSEESNFSALTEITWMVIMPGAPVAHNADHVEDNTLTWKPVPKGGIVNLRAESDVPRGTFNFPPCGSALLGVVLLVLKRRRL
jgi:hypothetical protein